MVNVSARHRLGFSLIELIVVIAIIAILAGMLMPALQKIREKGRQMVCMNNLNQIGKAIYMYANDYDGYIVPAWSPYAASPFWQDLLLPYLGKYRCTLTEEGSAEELLKIPFYKCPSSPEYIPAPPPLGGFFWGGNSEYQPFGGYCPLYGINGYLMDNLLKIEKVPMPSQKILVGETQHILDLIFHYTYYEGGGAEIFQCPYNEFPEPTTETGRHLNAYRHNDGANFLFVDGHVEWWPRLGKDWKDPDIDGAYNKHWDLTAP